MLNILLPAIVKQKSFNSNPLRSILRLQNKLIYYSAVKESTILGIYLIDNINSINKNSFNTDSSYCGLNKNFVIKKPLNSWDFLKDFKSKAGIYQFVCVANLVLIHILDLQKIFLKDALFNIKIMLLLNQINIHYFIVR